MKSNRRRIYATLGVVLIFTTLALGVLPTSAKGETYSDVTSTFDYMENYYNALSGTTIYMGTSSEYYSVYYGSVVAGEVYRITATLIDSTVIGDSIGFAKDFDVLAVATTNASNYVTALGDNQYLVTIPESTNYLHVNIWRDTAFTIEKVYSCIHDSTYLENVYFVKDDTYHTTKIWCNNCESYLGENGVDEVHDYLNGVCSLCDHSNTCQHSLTYRAYEPNNDGTHGYNEICTPCGVTLSSGRESCTYGSDDICDYCDQTKPATCEHGSTFETFSPTSSTTHIYEKKCSDCLTVISWANAECLWNTENKCALCTNTKPETTTEDNTDEETTEKTEIDNSVSFGDNTFTDLFTGIYDSMVKVFYGLTDYMILGYNISNLILGLFTLVIVIIVIKKVT